MEEKDYLYCVDKDNEVYRVSVERDDDTSYSNPREWDNLGKFGSKNHK